MPQTVPATAVLGPGKTGLPIGLRVLNLDGTTYSAFSTTGVAETSTLGTYRKANGAVVPDAGGYIVWGVAGTDYAEATVDPLTAPTAATIATEVWAGEYTRSVNTVGSVTGNVGGTVSNVLAIGGVTMAEGSIPGVQAGLPGGLPLLDANLIGGGLTAQQTRDAMKLAPTAGAPADGSIDDHLDDLATALAAATIGLTVVSAVDGDVLTIYQAVSLSATISGLAIPSAWTKLWFTVKADPAQADTAAVIQMVETNPGAGTDGLLRLNGVAGTAANGTLTVSQATGTVVIDLVDESTDDLVLATGLHWSIKALATGGATTLLAVGTMNVRGQATMAVA